MPTMADAGQIWKIIGELDINAMQEEANQTPRLALIGSPEKTSALQARLQQGPHSAEHLVTAAATFRLPLSPVELVELGNYDLRVLIVDDTANVPSDELQALSAQPAPLLTLVDGPQTTAIAVRNANADGSARPQQPRRVLACRLDDDQAVHKTLMPALVDALPDQEMGLGRAYPGLRPAVCQKLIQETAVANATYAFGTGVAEMVPVLGIPLTVADVFILTKNQLVLSYKISLTMGETAHLKVLAPKFAGVVGLGFVWRTIARQLVALVPFGIVPKVAIAYAGTYASGQAIYQWYVTGEKLEGRDLKAVLHDATVRGREFAEQMAAKVRRDKEPALIEASTSVDGSPANRAAPQKKGIRLPLPKRKTSQAA